MLRPSQLARSHLTGVIAIQVALHSAAGEGSLDDFDTLRDPTRLSSRVALGLEYGNQKEGAHQGKGTLTAGYAFGRSDRLDWMVSFEQAWIVDEPGTSGDRRETGLGDPKLSVGHVVDGVGRFRWGVGLGCQLDAATEPRFGDGAWAISPIWGGGYQLRPDLEWIAGVQFNGSVSEAAGRTPIRSLDARTAILKSWENHWFALAGWESSIDFQDQNTHSGTVNLEIGKAFGTRQHWVVSMGMDFPVERAAQENFVAKAGFARVF